MWEDILYFIVGLALIIGGANVLTDCASAVARRLKVSELVIGLTVVALGSSTPDLVVCLTSVIEGHSQLAMGDVLGSNLIDVLLVIGVVAVIKPFAPSRMMMTVDIPMLILSSFALLFCGDDKLIDGASVNIMNRSDGLMLLALFIIYMRFTFVSSKSDAATPLPASTSSPINTSHTATVRPSKLQVVKTWAGIIAGLVALVIGGNWVVSGASGMAKAFGMSESMIGLTVVAFCGAAPDLATAVVATLKGRIGIALGSTIGGCIINVLLCLGLASSIGNVDASHFASIDFLALAGGSVVLWLFCRVFTKGRFTRPEGILLILAYAAYMAYVVMTANIH